MTDIQPSKLKYFLTLAIWPAVIIVAVVIAMMVIAYAFDEDEFEPDDTRGDAVLETGMLIEPQLDCKLDVESGLSNRLPEAVNFLDRLR